MARFSAMKVIAEMPVLSHWPDRSKEFDPMNSKVCLWIAKRVEFYEWVKRCNMGLGLTMTRLKEMCLEKNWPSKGCVEADIFDPLVKDWFEENPHVLDYMASKARSWGAIEFDREIGMWCGADHEFTPEEEKLLDDDDEPAPPES